MQYSKVKVFLTISKKQDIKFSFDCYDLQDKGEPLLFQPASEFLPMIDEVGQIYMPSSSS